MIVLEQVSLALGEFSLQDVNLRISKGEYLVIMGPSGAGKTVLLETIAGLRFPDSGRILLDGFDASPACGEGLLPVRRGGGDDHRHVPDFKPPESVLHGEPGFRVGARDIRGDPVHLLLGHWKVGLVFEPDDRPPFVVVSDDADEKGEAAVRRAPEARHERPRVDRLGGQPRHSSMIRLPKRSDGWAHDEGPSRSRP